MRKKELKLVVAFNSTSAAMKMEKICIAKGLEGRLIPIPKTISAGCGLAWCCRLDGEQAIRALVEEGEVSVLAIQECML